MSRPGVCRAGAQRKAPRRGAGLKVDRVRRLKAPVSPSPPIPQQLHRFQSRGRALWAIYIGCPKNASYELLRVFTV